MGVEFGWKRLESWNSRAKSLVGAPDLDKVIHLRLSPARPATKYIDLASRTQTESTNFLFKSNPATV